MPAKRKRMALKSALLAPGGTLTSWGVQQFISGETLTGAVGMAIGALFIVGYIVLQEYDIPYEEEIVDVIGRNRGALDEDTIRAISEEVSRAAEERDIDVSNGETN